MWEDKGDQVRPGRVSNPETAHQGANRISLRGQRPSHTDHEQRDGKDDEGLHQIPLTLLSCRHGIRSQQTNLLGEVPHNSKQTSSIHAIGKVINEGPHIAESIAREPLSHVVVAPDEGVEHGLDVLEFHGQDEDDGGELAVAVEEAQGDQADEVGDDGEEDAEDEVGRQCVGGVGAVARDGDDHGVAAVAITGVDVDRGSVHGGKTWLWQRNEERGLVTSVAVFSTIRSRRGRLMSWRCSKRDGMPSRCLLSR